MKNRKILASAIILGAGVIGIYFIMNSSAVKNDDRAVATKFNNVNIIKNPIQWIKKTKNSIIEATVDSNLKNVVNTDDKSDKNLTDLFGKMIFEEIKLKNEEGPVQQDGSPVITVLNEESMSEEIFKKIKKGEFGDFSIFSADVVRTTNLKISQDNSTEFQVQYIKNIMNAGQKNLLSFDKGHIEILSDIMEKQDFSSVEKAVEVYEKIINNYYEISIPSNWVDFHKATIIHLNGLKNFYKALINYKIDPLKAYAAVNLYSQLEESQYNLINLFAAQIVKNNLVSKVEKLFN